MADDEDIYMRPNEFSSTFTAAIIQGNTGTAVSIRKCSPGRDRFLGVDAQQEVSLLSWFKRRRHDAVSARRQPVTPRDFTHVDELRRFGNRRVVLEEVQVQRSTVRVFQLRFIQQNFVGLQK